MGDTPYDRYRYKWSSGTRDFDWLLSQVPAFAELAIASMAAIVQSIRTNSLAWLVFDSADVEPVAIQPKVQHVPIVRQRPNSLTDSGATMTRRGRRHGAACQAGSCILDQPPPQFPKSSCLFDWEACRQASTSS